MIVIGDRVLIRPDDETRTQAGLDLPQGTGESADVRAGRVISRGPGVPLPSPEHQRDRRGRASAALRRRPAIEVRYEGETFLVVPQSAVLVVVRDS